MLPPIASTTGHLDSAEAIYEGPNQNLLSASKPFWFAQSVLAARGFAWHERKRQVRR